MKFLITCLISACCLLTAANATYPAPDVALVETPVPAGDVIQAEMESCHYGDTYDYDETTMLTDYESHANIGPEGDLVGDTSTTDNPLAFQSA